MIKNIIKMDDYLFQTKPKRAKITCACGSIIYPESKPNHLKTKKHKAYLEQYNRERFDNR